MWFLPRDAMLDFASAVYAMALCLSIRDPSVCHKPLSVGSRKQRHTAHGIYFSDAKDLGEIPRGSPQRGRQIQVE